MEKEAAVGYLEGVIEKLLRSLASLNRSFTSRRKRLCSSLSKYHKFRQEFSDFYKSALLYLAIPLWRPLNRLSWYVLAMLVTSCSEDLAFDLSLSALLGENIYNFGELLAHPILKSLLGTNVEWLYHILQAFNHGDLVQYQELCRGTPCILDCEPALVENEKKLLEKINILCLIEIIFSRPAEDRTIPLTVIAERIKLSIEDVEHLLMKSLSVSSFFLSLSPSLLAATILHFAMGKDESFV
ncbi:hypothetical protein Bca52824_071886 [Brassica carinata]|uniref:PCI domain-containing protein n=1 Tax=Brassica carinata TaxID=52824 RepID=A0A8X7Q8F7_BRACI|nr:hypothetical protein Bca52824_071886 [Brassica carinata]